MAAFAGQGEVLVICTGGFAQATGVVETLADFSHRLVGLTHVQIFSIFKTKNPLPGCRSDSRSMQPEDSVHGA